MPPTYPPPPHNSLQATGTTGAEFPYQQNPGRDPVTGRWLPVPIRSMGHRRTGPLYRPAIFATCSAAAATLNALWATMSPSQRATWTDHAKRWRLTLYLAFLKFNMRNAVQGLPFTDHPPD